MEINKTELKKILKEQRKEYQRYIGALEEDFESQTKLIAESVAGIQNQLIALRDIVVKNTEDIEIIRNMVVKNTEDIEMIRDMVAKNTEDIEMIRMDIGIIKNDLKEKVSRDEFVALEKRLYLLEKKVQRI